MSKNEDSRAYSLGWYERTNSAQTGGPDRPKRKRHAGRQLTDAEWAEYQRGWDDAWDSYDIDNA